MTDAPTWPRLSTAGAALRGGDSTTVYARGLSASETVATGSHDTPERLKLPGSYLAVEQVAAPLRTRHYSDTRDTPY